MARSRERIHVMKRPDNSLVGIEPRQFSHTDETVHIVEVNDVRALERAMDFPAKLVSHD